MVRLYGYLLVESPNGTTHQPTRGKRNMKKYIRSSERSSEYPDDLIWAVRQFSYWILNELRSSHISTLPEALDYLYSRTINNPRSGMFQRTEDQANLDLIASYVESVDELISIAVSIRNARSRETRKWKKAHGVDRLSPPTGRVLIPYMPEDGE